MQETVSEVGEESKPAFFTMPEPGGFKKPKLRSKKTKESQNTQNSNQTEENRPKEQGLHVTKKEKCLTEHSAGVIAEQVNYLVIKALP